MKSIIVPTDQTNYKMFDRFNRAGEIHQVAPTYSKAGNSWSVVADTILTSVYSTDASGFLTNPNPPGNEPGPTEFVEIDIGETYNNIFFDFLVPDTERISLFVHCTGGILRGQTGHSSHELRIIASTVYNTNLKSRIDAASTDCVDDGTGDGNGTGDQIDTVLTSGTRTHVLLNYKNGVYTLKMGDFVRRFTESTDLSANTVIGISYSINAATCKCFDFRVW